MSAAVDTLIRVETPENIELQAECVGLLSRCLAFLIDGFIRTVMLILVAIAAAFLGKAGYGLFILTWFGLNWFYPVLFEVLRNGQTPGKRVMGLRVLHEDLSPIGWSASLLRNLLRVVDSLPFAYLLGLLSVTISTRFQRLGDLAAGSLVVYENNVLPSPSVPGVSPQRPPVPLQLEEQVALMSFVRRAGRISRDRQLELAGILAGVAGPEGEGALSYWQGVGLGLTGET